MSDELVSVLRELAEAQRPLDADIAKVLEDNLWDLYIEDEA